MAAERVSHHQFVTSKVTGLWTVRCSPPQKGGIFARALNQAGWRVLTPIVVHADHNGF